MQQDFLTTGRILLARTAAVLLLLVLFGGTLYGRYFERTFAALISYIPHVSLGFVVLATTFSAYYLKEKYRFTRNDLRSTVLLKAAISALVLSGLLVFVCESLIVSPIERIHFLKYGSLSFFLYFAQAHPSVARKLLIAGVLSATIGTIEECLQYFVPNRVFDTKDIVMNIIAAVSGIAFTGILLQVRSALIRHQVSV